MVFGIGVDIFSILRITRLKDDFKDPFFRNAFTEEERAQALSRTSPGIFFVTRFAGKEAVYKAISRCGCDFIPKDIEILDLENGQPTVSLHGRTEVCLKQYHSGDYTLHISISYEDEFAEAFAIMEI